MADTKISNLTALAAAPAVGDLLAIVDVSASETKKITTAYLYTPLAQLAAANAFTVGQTIETGATGTIGLVVDTPASPTANLAEFRNNGTGIVSVSPYGALMYSSYLGTQATKSLASGAATAIATITIGGGSALAIGFLVTLTTAPSGASGSAIYPVTVGFSTVTVGTAISSALYGMTVLSMTASINTGTRVVTLTVTQTNGAAAAASVYVTITPLGVFGTSQNLTFASL